MARKKLGALLEKKGLITEFQLVAALSHQRKWKMRLGKALLEHGYIEEKPLFQVLAEQWGMELVDLYDAPITEDVKKKMSREKGMALMAMPVRIEEDTLVVAIAEPDRENIQQDLEKLTGMSVRLVLGMDSQVEELTRTLPEKVSVASVKPVKKAFRKNEDGGLEAVASHEIASAELLGAKETKRAKPRKSEPVDVGDVQLSSPEPAEVPEETEPVELQEVDEAEEESAKQPAAVKPEALAVDVPDIDLGGTKAAPIHEPVPAKPSAAEPESEPGTEKHEPVEDTDEFWSGAKTAKSAEEIPASKKAEEPVEELDKSSEDFFPGQTRSFDESAPEPEPEPEEEPEKELELKPEEEVQELGVSDITEPAEPKPESVPQVPEPPELRIEDKPKISESQPAAAKPAPPPPMPETEAPRRSIRPETIKPAEAPKKMVAGLERELVLQKIMEIEQKIKALAIMVEELREKLQD
jgi:hypothetical protein